MYIFVNKRFHRHPYPFIALSCLSEGLMYNMMFYPNFTCQFNLPWLLTRTKAVFKLIYQPWDEATSIQQDYKSLLTLQFCQKFMYEISGLLNLFFNSIVFIDLYLTIKHPFYPREL